MNPLSGSTPSSLQVADYFGHFVERRVATGVLVQGHVESGLGESQFEELASIDEGDDSVFELIESFEITLDRPIGVSLGEPPRRVRRVID